MSVLVVLALLVGSIPVMALIGNGVSAEGEIEVCQYFWGSPSYHEYTSDNGTPDNNLTKYTWTADTTNVADWDPTKSLSMNNKYSGVWSSEPTKISAYVSVGDNGSYKYFGNRTKGITITDGYGSADKTEANIKFTVSVLKSNNDLLVSLDATYLEGCTASKFNFRVVVDFSDSYHESITEVKIGSGNSSQPEPYETGESHKLTINATGILERNVFLIDMGDKMDLIAGAEPGDHIVRADSVVGTTDLTKIIASGSDVPSGTFVGIWSSAPFVEDGKMSSLSIQSGQTEIGYYLVSETEQSVKEYMFRMPEGDTTVTVSYSSKQLTIEGDHGSVTATRVMNNVSYQDQYFFEGEVISLTTTADEGYIFESFEVESGDISITNNRFTMGDSDVVIRANFVEKEYDISIVQDTGGTLSASKLKAKAGETITLTATISKGYYLKSISSQQIDGLSKESKTFVMPASNVTIAVEFEQMAQLTFTKTESSGMIILDVTVAASIGSELEDPTFLIAGTYNGDIVVNAYSHIKVGTNHVERVALSSAGLQEIFVQVVDGLSSNPTGYFCVYTVESGE